MTITADIGDVVRVVNTSPDPFVVAWDGKQYRLEPGRDTFMPFEAACLWFGDPRSSNAIQSVRNEQGIVSFVPDREAEVRRLRVKYGNIGGDERYVQTHPKVSVYDVQGEQITTVLDDPEGNNVVVATPTVTDQNNMMAMLAKQQRQIEMLMERLQKADERDITQKSSTPEDEDEPPPDDLDPNDALDLTDEDGPPED